MIAMDSANSASLQSSSAGAADDDFDSSTGQSISSFFNPGGLNPHRQNPNFFDDSLWSSAGFRSSANFTLPNFGGLTPAAPPTPSSSSAHQNSPFFPIQSAPPRAADTDGHGASKSPLSTVVKNPKKRTRASRRAPTTILTTDTTNFRQMVQEFTGIPSSPFAGSSPYTRRLDLFSSPSTSAAAAALRLGSHFDTLGPLYSLRPQFPPPQQPVANSRLNSTMIDSIVASTSIINPNSISGPDQILTLQNPSIPLQLSTLGGFGNGRDENDNDVTDERWKSRETVRRNHDDGEEEEEGNVATTAYDHHGNIDNNRSHHHQHQISNMNLKNLAGKGMGSNGSDGGGGGGGGSSSSGTVAPWIFPSQ